MFQSDLYCFHFGKRIFPGQCILGPERQEFEKKYGFHKLILSNQSGEAWAFTVYFVSLELLNRNEC